MSDVTRHAPAVKQKKQMRFDILRDPTLLREQLRLILGVSRANAEYKGRAPCFEADLIDFRLFKLAQLSLGAGRLRPLPIRKVSDELERDALGFMGLTTLKVSRNSLTSVS